MWYKIQSICRSWAQNTSCVGTCCSLSPMKLPQILRFPQCWPSYYRAINGDMIYYDCALPKDIWLKTLFTSEGSFASTKHTQYTYKFYQKPLMKGATAPWNIVFVTSNKKFSWNLLNLCWIVNSTTTTSWNCPTSWNCQSLALRGDAFGCCFALD